MEDKSRYQFVLPISLFEIFDWKQIFQTTNQNQDFSKNFWMEMFTNEEREVLKSFLPTGLSDNDVSKLLNQLFSGESFHFGNPIDKFWKKLLSIKKKGRNE